MKSPRCWKKAMASLKEIAREYADQLRYDCCGKSIAVWKKGRRWSAEEFMLNGEQLETLDMENYPEQFERAQEILKADAHAVVLGCKHTYGNFSFNMPILKVQERIETYYIIEEICELDECSEFSFRAVVANTADSISVAKEKEFASAPIEESTENSLKETEKQTDSKPGTVCVIDETVERYREIRKISARSLDQLCKQNNCHTLGSDCDYSRLLYTLTENKETLSTGDIIKIAENIVAHSRLELHLTVGRVASEVARIADVFFEKVCAEPLNRAPP